MIFKVVLLVFYFAITFEHLQRIHVMLFSSFSLWLELELARVWEWEFLILFI